MDFSYHARCAESADSLINHSKVFMMTVIALLSSAVAWEIQQVDVQHDFDSLSQHSLRLDARGHPHVTYGGNSLYYAWFDGTKWHFETVDTSPGVGEMPSLALDLNGNPYISYFDQTDGDLKYAQRVGLGWRVETIDIEGGYVGRFSSIAIDAEGYPHISYRDEINNDLKYAYEDESGWHVTIVDSQDNAGAHTSLVLDAEGHPHISYAYSRWLGSYSIGAVRYAIHDGSAWEIETVESGIDYTIGATSLALDGLGNAHIAYSELWYWKMKYARNDGSGWQMETVESDLNTYYFGGSLVLDAEENPHISYWERYQNYPRDLIYARKAGETWHFDTVNNMPSSGISESSLDLDQFGQPHICYLPDSWQSVSLTYASNTGSGWDCQFLDFNGEVGRYGSLVLDDSDNPHLSYDKGGLQYAYLSGDEWRFEYAWLPLSGLTALQLDEDRQPHIYYEYDEIRYAWREDSDWHSEEVWTGVGYGVSVSDVDLSLSPDGVFHATNDYRVSFDFPPWYVWGLTYRCRTDTGWIGEAIESGQGGPPLIYNSLEMDTMNSPHIAYSFYGLKYAYKDSSGLWQKETVDPAHTRDISLVLDQEGYPHISYVTITGGILKYASSNGENWNIEAIEDQNEGANVSLALDTNGLPHIAYHNPTIGDLRYAYKGPDGWHMETVDSEGIVGQYASLAIGSNGHVHISYWDETNSAIKYAYGELPPTLLLIGDVAGDQLHLSWTPIFGAQEYWIYGVSNQAYFQPGFAPGFDYRLDILAPETTSWSSSNGVGDPDHNWTYLVIAVDASENEIARSNRVGEHDFATNIP